MSAISSITLRVRYAETDRMGVVYHANYLVWCDMARTEHLRQHGVSYRELEDGGLLLAVTGADLRFRAPAHFDDHIDIRCWTRHVTSRGVEFGYAIDRRDGTRLATARTRLIALDSSYVLTQLPRHVRAALTPIADPVRL